MSGHSKWANIKNRKGAEDAKKGRVFGQLSKLIRVAVQEGGSGNPDHNPALRLVLEKARAANMPKENVQRAIDRGLGKGKEGQLQEILYEGFGPQGVGFLALAVTDNKQRTGGEIRLLFSRAGGSLAGPHSVQYLFSRSPQGDYTPLMPMAIDDEAVFEQLLKLRDGLLENQDVEEVFCSAVLDD